MPGRWHRAATWADRAVLLSSPRPRLDPGHPLAPSRAWLFHMIEGAVGAASQSIRVPELTGHAVDALVNSNAGLTRGGGQCRWGKGIESIESSDGIHMVDCGIDTDVLETAGKMTMVFHKRRTSTVTTKGYTFGTVDPVSDFTKRCGANVPYNDGNIYFDYGGVTSGSSRLSVADSFAVADNVWAFTVGARGMEIWKNGAKIASNGGTPTRGSTGTSFYIGGGNDAVTFHRADYHVIPFFYIYHRQLTEAEILQICYDPYQVLLPVTLPRHVRHPASVYTIPVPGTAVTVGDTSTSSPTTQSYTTGAGETYLVVRVGLMNSNAGTDPTVASVTFGATSLSLLGAQAGFRQRAELWGGVVAASTTATVTVTYSGTSRNATVAIESYAGVTSVGTAKTATMTGGSTLSVSFDSGDLVTNALMVDVLSVHAADNSGTLGSGQTAEYTTFNDGASQTKQSGSREANIGSLGWTGLNRANADPVQVAVPLIGTGAAPSGAAGKPTSFYAMQRRAR